MNPAICLLGVAAMVFASPANTKDVVKPGSRAEATAIIAQVRKIVTPDGVERLEKVHINGIDQWVSVRGTDRRNPVLILIHGGPGYPSMPMSWWFSRDWEEYFTVVQWDQRASGKTHLLNDAARITPTLTRETMLGDAEAMIGWARRELGKKKIFLMGHSYGSSLGLEIARRHPEWLHAYIGVGQLTDGPEGERRGWKFAMDAARDSNNAEAMRKLEAIAPYADTSKPLALEHIFAERRWIEFFGGTMAYRQGNKAESDLAQLSPDYTDDEIQHVWDGNAFIERHQLAEALSLNLGSIKKLDCPLILFAGRHDRNVNSEVAAEWFATVAAPEKHFIWFEHSAHLPMTEEPGKFFLSLVEYARPLAVRAGDGAP